MNKILPLVAMLLLAACSTTKSPNEGQGASIEAATSQAVTAECQIYDGTDITPPECEGQINLPNNNAADGVDMGADSADTDS